MSGKQYPKLELKHQKLYRVVETRWVGGNRVESDLGCAWKPEAKAREEMKVLARKFPSRLFSLQKQV